MKVVIPMAGKGKRFERFGIPKPLLEIDGKPMIEKVLDYFPRNTEFVFICNTHDIKYTRIQKVLLQICPAGKIIQVPDSLLKGPAFSLQAAFDSIADDEEVIVNYCDFIQSWDFKEFMEKIRKKKPHGAIVSFRGFHPSSMGDTKYAYLKTSGDWVMQIREKESFTKNRMNEFGSTGTYYFASGKILKQHVRKLVSDEKNAVNGEFYVSLVFNPMIQDGLKILNYEARRFICLGTPRDYELYKFWSEFFLRYSPHMISFNNIDLNVVNVVPLAGKDRDFAAVGFDGPDFLLPLMNNTLLHYSMQSNPKGIRKIFVLHKDEKKELDKHSIFSDAASTTVESRSLTGKPRVLGNAVAIYNAKTHVGNKGVCVSGASYILDYDERRLANLLEQPDVDVVLFSFSHHDCVLRNPEGFAYAKIKNNIEVEKIIEKQTISDNPYADQALTGTAIFKRSEDLFDAIEDECAKVKKGNVYYLNSLNHILQKKKVVLFEVNKFVPIRNRTNYLEFRYWQDYFDEMPEHPYSKILQ